MKHILFMFISGVFALQNIFKVLYGNGNILEWIWLLFWIIMGAVHTTLYENRRAK